MALIVNGETIDDAVIRQEAAVLRPRYQEMMEGDPVELEVQLREWSRENVIERVLLRQEAARDPQPIAFAQIEEALAAYKAHVDGQAGCNIRTTDEDLRAEIEARLRLDRLVGRVTGAAPRPKNAEINDYYRKNQDRFWTPEMVHAAHIVKNVDDIQDEQTARSALEEVERQLQSGARFEELADLHSDCKGNGGDLGFFPRGDMVAEFDGVVFSLTPGKLSGIFRTTFGFHIAKVYERRAAGVRPFADVREEIEQILYGEKQQKAVEDFIDRLREKADIRTVRG